MTTFTKSIVGGIGAQLSPGITREDELTLRHAALNFGFLLPRGQTLTPREFAERISSTYAASLKRDEVLAALERAAVLDEDVEAELAEPPRIRA